jgi:hypothetical protein
MGVTPAAEVVGWRVFALGEDAALVPAFQYWPAKPQAEEPWAAGWTHARCLAEAGRERDHADDDVPHPDCSCGLHAVTDLAELLAAAAAGRFPGREDSVLDAAGVLARVALGGRVLPSAAECDPPTTFRGARARVLEVHLPPRYEDAALSVSDRYGVAAVMYEPDEWPGAVAPLPGPYKAPPVVEDVAGFLSDLAALPRFGLKSTADPAGYLGTGRHVADALRGGLTVSDVARELFDSSARPTVSQALALVALVQRHLAPDVAAAPLHPLRCPPLTSAEADARKAEYPPGADDLGRDVRRPPVAMGIAARAARILGAAVPSW